MTKLTHFSAHLFSTRMMNLIVFPGAMWVGAIIETARQANGWVALTSPLMGKVKMGLAGSLVLN